MRSRGAQFIRDRGRGRVRDSRGGRLWAGHGLRQCRRLLLKRGREQLHLRPERPRVGCCRRSERCVVIMRGSTMLFWAYVLRSGPPFSSMLTSDCFPDCCTASCVDGTVWIKQADGSWQMSEFEEISKLQVEHSFSSFCASAYTHFVFCWELRVLARCADSYRCRFHAQIHVSRCTPGAAVPN